MNLRTRCYAISAGIHGTALALIILLATCAASRKEVVTIDFNLEDTPPQVFSAPAKQLVSQLHKSLPALRKPVCETVVKPAVQFVAVAAPDKTQSVAGNAGSEQSIAAFTNRQGVATTGTSNFDKESVAEQGRKKYLKENFAYIRDLIMKRLSYPPLARKMEWSGKVVLSFVVAENGGVDSISLKESSGYPVLDNSAMETVRSVAPFPRPPAAAEIVMPVQYRLQ